MSDSFIDHLPSHEREKIRRRLRSPDEYERLRALVKGPEDLEKELAKAEQIADANLELQTNPESSERLKSQVETDLREEGIDRVLEHGVDGLDAGTVAALEQGQFTVEVTPDDGVSLVPEGNVSDRLPVKSSLSDRYVQSLIKPSGGQ